MCHVYVDCSERILLLILLDINLSLITVSLTVSQSLLLIHHHMFPRLRVQDGNHRVFFK